MKFEEYPRAVQEEAYYFLQRLSEGKKLPTPTYGNETMQALAIIGRESGYDRRGEKVTYDYLKQTNPDIAQKGYPTIKISQPPLEGKSYYDPKTRQVTQMSIDPNVAKQKGYIDVTNTADININMLKTQTELRTQQQNQEQAKLQPGQTPSAIMPATTGEKIRGTIREKTGVSLPSLKQTYRELTGQGDEIPKPIKTIDVIAAPATFVSKGLTKVSETSYDFYKSILPKKEIKITEPAIIKPTGPNYRGGTLSGELIEPAKKITVSLPEVGAFLATTATTTYLTRKIPAQIIFTGTGIEGTRVALDKTRPEQERLMGAVVAAGSGAVLLGVGGYRAYKELTAPVVLYSRTPQQTKFLGLVKQKGDNAAGAIISQTDQEVYKLTTTKWDIFRGNIARKIGSDIDVPLKSFEVIKRTDYSVIPYSSKNELSLGLIATKKAGASLTNIRELRAITQEIPFKDLSSTKQNIINYVGKRYKEGIIPIDSEGQPTVRFFVGQAETTKGFPVKGDNVRLIKFTDKTKTIDVLKTPPTKVTRITSVSKVENVGTLKSTTGDFQVFRVDSSAKPSESLFPRARGKVYQSKGFVLVGQAADDTTESNIINLKDRMIRLKQQQSKLVADISAKAAAIPKPKPITVPIKAETKIITPTKVEQITPVASLSVKESLFAGTGKYERTEGGGIITIPSQQQKIKNNAILIDKYTTSNITVTDEKERSKDSGIFISPPIVNDFLTTRPSEGFKEPQKSALRQEQPQKSTQKSRQEFNLITPQIIPPAINITEPGTTIPKPPVIKPKLDDDGLIKKVKSKSSKDLYLPQIKRKGKYLSIGKGTSKEAAFALGKKKVLETLAASFRIVETKTGKPISFSKTDNVFRFGKKGKDITTLVQRKGGKEGGLGRLSSFGEIREIQMSRRKLFK